jgi:hypothetical protein
LIKYQIIDVAVDKVPNNSCSMQMLYFCVK